MRSKLPLSDDQNVHRAVLAYASDIGLLTTAITGDDITNVRQVISLDHSMWFHSDIRMDEWVMFVTVSPRGSAERALAIGRIYRQDGVLAVSIGQEGIIRMKMKGKL